MKTAWICATVVTAVLVGAVTALTWHINTDAAFTAAMTFFAGIAGGAVVGGISHFAAQNGANAAIQGAATTTTPPQGVVIGDNEASLLKGP